MSRWSSDALCRLALLVGCVTPSAAFSSASSGFTTFAAGVPLVDALDSAAGAAGNVVYKDAILKIKTEVSGGTQLNHAMRQANLFPSMVVQMVAIGEESGALGAGGGP